MLRQMPVHRYICIEYVPAVTKGVMQHGLGLLLMGTRNTDDVDDRDVLGERWMNVSVKTGEIRDVAYSPPAIPFMALSSPTPNLMRCEIFLGTSQDLCYVGHTWSTARQVFPRSHGRSHRQYTPRSIHYCTIGSISNSKDGRGSRYIPVSDPVKLRMVLNEVLCTISRVRSSRCLAQCERTRKPV